MRILITGASGFVGRALLPRLRAEGHILRGTSRANSIQTPDADSFVVTEIGPHTDWRAALQDIDLIVHLAARVHQLGDTVLDPLAQYRAVNTLGTLNLAQQAVDAGVRRFVFISSAKVWGEGSGDGAFDEGTTPAPQDPYGISKWEAEQGLQKLAAQSGMEFVVLRPPLVYGPGVRANFLRLMRWVDRAYPMPFASINNRRSLIGIGNLVDAITRCIDAPTAANQVFGVADETPLSTPDLIRKLAGQLHRRARLFHVPPAALSLAAQCMGRSQEMERLTGNLVVDIEHIRKTLDWQPPYSLESELSRTVSWYRAAQGK